MHKGLVDFKKEVEQELLNAKQVWLNVFTETFIETSPSPSKTETSTGFFINQTDIKIGSRINRYNLNIMYRNRKRSKKFTSTKETVWRSGASRRPIMSAQQKFSITSPYENIIITNYVTYNKYIEILGWHFTGKQARSFGREPYRPFKISKDYASFYMNIYLRNQKRTGFNDEFQEDVNNRIKRSSLYL